MKRLTPAQAETLILSVCLPLSVVVGAWRWWTL